MISILNLAAFTLYDVFGQFWDTIFSYTVQGYVMWLTASKSCSMKLNPLFCSFNFIIQFKKHHMKW